MDQSNSVVQDIHFVKNFLDADDVQYIKNWVLESEQQRIGKYESWSDALIGINEPIFNKLLEKYKPKMSEISGAELVPKYTFWRLSTKGNTLPLHIDRPPCEYSITINIACSDDRIWPFYVDHEDCKRFMMSSGDAVLYNGIKYLHWRDELLSDWIIQFCMHYTNKNGPLVDVTPNTTWGSLEGTPALRSIMDHINEVSKIVKKYAAIQKTPTSEV